MVHVNYVPNSPQPRDKDNHSSGNTSARSAILDCHGVVFCNGMCVCLCVFVCVCVCVYVCMCVRVYVIAYFQQLAFTSNPSRTYVSRVMPPGELSYHGHYRYTQNTAIGIRLVSTTVLLRSPHLSPSLLTPLNYIPFASQVRNLSCCTTRI